MNLARKLVIFIVGILSAGRLAAQTAECRHRTVLVNILDTKNQIVNDLRPEDLSGSFRHKRVKIASVTSNSFLPRVFIVLDARGGVRNLKPAWQYSIEAANRLVDSMPAGTFIGMIIFAKNIQKTIPLGNNALEIKAELEKLRAGNEPALKNGRATALWDALDEAISEMRPAQEGDAIYAITNGFDISSKVSTKSMQETFLATRIRLFCFSVDNPEMLATPETYGRLRDFHYLVSDSGGFALDIRSNGLGAPIPLTDKSARPTFEGEMLLAQLHQIFYYQRVGIELPEQPEKAGEWTLNAKGKKFRDPHVVYPHMLDACTEAKTALNAAH
jgi:hypothetical protein